MKKLLFVFAATSLMMTGCCDHFGDYTTPDEMVAEATEIVETITVDQLNELMNGEEIYTLIDVRQEVEHYYGYIPGSLNIPRGSLEFLIGKEDYWESTGLYMPLKDEIIVLYCKKGNRGLLAAMALKRLGYDKVVALDGGWKEWELTYPDMTEKNLDMLGGQDEEVHDMGGGC